MKKFFAIVLFVCLLALPAMAAEEGSTVLQMEKAEMIIYGELQRGGLIDRLNALEAVLFGRSLPGTIAERQQALLSFIQDGGGEQASLLFKIGVAEWSVSQTIYPTVPALGRIQKLERDLEGVIQEGKPLAMRTERLLAMLLTDTVVQKEMEISSDVPIKAQILDAVGPGKSRKGDNVRIELTENLVIDQMLIAPKGSRVITEIGEVKKPGAFGKPGEVLLDLKYIEILGSQRPKIKILDTRKDGEKGEKNIAAAAGASMVGAIVLGPLGLATGLLIRGDAINIAAGTPILLQFAEKTRLSAFPLPASLTNEPVPAGGVTEEKKSEEIFVLPPVK